MADPSVRPSSRRDAEGVVAGGVAPTRMARGRRGARVLIVLVALAITGSPTGAAADTVGDPSVAPTTTLSADGRTATDGIRTLAVAQAVGLEGSGTILRVSGSGYDEHKGIYVALCAIPPANHVPSPCGGGVDTDDSQGAAQWISSNPPSYGVGLAQPYGPGGSFQTSFAVRAEISPGIDCRQIRCAVVTRNDHTRTTDRSQDILIPVTFAVAPTTTSPTVAPAPAPTVAPPTPVPTTVGPALTVPPLANPTTTAPAPVATLAADGRSASDGARTLAVSVAADLDPRGGSVAVSGQGFDVTRGIYVSLCAVSDDGPGPCGAGAPDVSRWVSTNPPDYGVGAATAFGPGGTFEVELVAIAVIDGATDCRATACAIVARADDTAPGDRTLDLAVPVSFADAGAEPTGTTAAAPAATDTLPDERAAESSELASSTTDPSAAAGPTVAIGVASLVALVLAGVVGTVVATRGRAAPTDPGGPSVEDAP